MLTNSQIAVAVVVVTVITFVCRIVPFVLLRGRQDSAVLAFLSRAMPLRCHWVAVKSRTDCR